MAWLVVWFRDGKLYKSAVCNDERTFSRTANSFNEHAQFWNRFGKHSNVVGVISSEEALDEDVQSILSLFFFVIVFR